jgi:hypothetical protein
MTELPHKRRQYSTPLFARPVQSRIINAMRWRLRCVRRQFGSTERTPSARTCST